MRGAWSVGFGAVAALGLLSAHAAQPTDAELLFESFARAPTEARLVRLRDACVKQEVSAELFYPHQERFRRPPSLLKARALAILLDRCADEATREDLAGLLSSELVSGNGRQVVAALAQERVSAQGLAAVASSLGLLEESPLGDCEAGDECQKRARALIDRKMSILRAIPATEPGELDVVRRLLRAEMASPGRSARPASSRKR